MARWTSSAALEGRGFRDVWLFDEESQPAERLPGRSGFLFGSRVG